MFDIKLSLFESEVATANLTKLSKYMHICIGPHQSTSVVHAIYVLDVCMHISTLQLNFKYRGSVRIMHPVLQQWSKCSPNHS